jgi:cytochrome P450
MNYDFRLLAFSSGRRQCPAANLGFLKVQHAIALLVHAFDWSLPEGELEVNMEDEGGIVSPKKFPLLTLAKPRLDLAKLRSV